MTDCCTFDARRALRITEEDLSRAYYRKVGHTTMHKLSRVHYKRVAHTHTHTIYLWRRWLSASGRNGSKVRRVRKRLLKCNRWLLANRLCACVGQVTDLSRKIDRLSKADEANPGMSRARRLFLFSIFLSLSCDYNTVAQVLMNPRLTYSPLYTILYTVVQLSNKISFIYKSTYKRTKLRNTNFAAITSLIAHCI